MSAIANTPEPPYYAVIFTSHLTESDSDYTQTAERMVQLASQQPGFLGVESVRDGMGITVSYWSDTKSIKAWKQNTEHLVAQKKGRDVWYQKFKIRIAKIERDYGFSKRFE